MKTLKNIIKRCEVCQKNNPKTEKLAKSGLQRSGKYLGEDWEIDFTHMPKANGYSCLQVWVDTFHFIVIQILLAFQSLGYFSDKAHTY